MAGSSSCDHKVPQFFTSFDPDRCSNYLHINPFFKTHLEENAAKKATIKRSGTNQQWNVHLVKVGEEFCFAKGWKKFVQDSNLSTNEFMVFQYHGNSNFTVDIYGKHGCLKENVEEGEEIADIDLDDDDDDDDGNDDNDGDDEEDENDNNKGVKKRARAGRPSNEDPNSEAVKAAKLYMKLHSDYPSFRVSVGSGYVKKHLLNIPIYFVDAHMEETRANKRSIDLQVMDKLWRVDMIVYRFSSSPNCKLSKGIPAFVRDNHIKEGDVLVFELVKPNAFRVAIFPC